MVERDVISLVIHSGFTGLFLVRKDLIHTFALGICGDNRGKILQRNRQCGGICECVDTVYRRLLIWIWRGDRHQHTEAACARTDGTEGPYDRKIYYIRKRTGTAVDRQNLRRTEIYDK